MKSIIPFVLSFFVIGSLLSACGDLNGAGTDNTDPATTDTDFLPTDTSSQEPSETDNETLPTDDQSQTTAFPSVKPSATAEVTNVPTSPNPDIMRDESGSIVVYYNGEAETIDAALVYSVLGENSGYAFSIYSDTATYVGNFDNNAYRFSAQEEETVLNYIEISYISGSSAQELMPSFMDLYIDFSDIEFSSITKIGADGIECQTITASNAEQYITAYISDADGGVLSFVISSSIEQSNFHQPRLAAMLSTLMLHYA